MDVAPPLPPQQTPPALPPQQQGMGCFARGCLILIVVGIIFLGVAGVGIWIFYGKAIMLFTSSQPVDVRIEQVSDVDLRNAQEKLDRLGQATLNDEETQVEFTAAEINALIARHPSFAQIKDRARVAIADSTMTIELSTPLDETALPKLRGRWFNGTARVGFSFGDDEFVFDLKSGEANGHELPSEFITGFTPSFNRSFNDGFRRSIEKNDAGANLWRHVKSVSLDGDKLVILTKRL